MKVSGYLRGTPLNANNLVHIQNWGDFHLSSVDIEPTNNRHINKFSLTPLNHNLDKDNNANVIQDEEIQSVIVSFFMVNNNNTI